MRAVRLLVISGFSHSRSTEIPVQPCLHYRLSVSSRYFYVHRKINLIVIFVTVAVVQILHAVYSDRALGHGPAFISHGYDCLAMPYRSQGSVVYSHDIFI